MESSFAGQYVGPYRLDKTLGKGQTGLVKLGVHCITGMKVAIKIINREKLNGNVINKVEREIAIMKLIEHPNILGLLDVYENKKYLYLILELVSGGELFDYLVKKGRLIPREARRFFRQIICAVDYCHSHNVCHRDLKPENLLLDEENDIKVADFGMASLQPKGFLLETSCGSPHYACPEVIKGERYDGRTADVWSCGVILFALLVGALPFDDDNLRHLLEKVKRGVYHIPHFVPPDAQDLLRGMINVRPEQRISLQQVLKHPWMRPIHSIESTAQVPQTPSFISQCNPLVNEEAVDPDVLSSMSSLGCFSDRNNLVLNLLNNKQTTEKVIYYMLLHRKKRHPSFDDDANSLPYKHPDAPRKRVDSTSSLTSCGDEHWSGLDDSKRKLSTGSFLLTNQSSPLLTRKQAIESHQRSQSISGESHARQAYNVCMGDKSSVNVKSETLMKHVASSSKDTPVPWKQRLSNLKNSFIGSPKFHRKKSQDPGEDDFNGSDSSSELTKRSWFGGFISNRLMPTENLEDYTFSIIFRDRTLTRLKGELVHTFLSIPNITHSTVSPVCFRCEYRPSGPVSASVFYSRSIKFQADIIDQSINNNIDVRSTQTIGHYLVTFTLLSGPTRRFRRVMELIQSYIPSC